MTTDAQTAMRLLADAAERILAELERTDAPRWTRTAARLRDSVIGPLRRAGTAGEQGVVAGRRIGRPPEATPDGGAVFEEPVGPMAGRLWGLAGAATGLCGEQGSAGLTEAAAALHDLALGLADEPAEARRAASWRRCSRSYPRGSRPCPTAPTW